MYIIYETEIQSAINIEGLHRYLVLLTLDNSTTVGGGVHEQAVKTKPVTISRKPWKNPVKLDLIMNTDVSTLMRSKKGTCFSASLRVTEVSIATLWARYYDVNRWASLLSCAAFLKRFSNRLIGWLTDWLIDWLVSYLQYFCLLPTFILRERKSISGHVHCNHLLF